MENFDQKIIKWQKKWNVAQYKGASWDTLMKRVKNTSVEQAKQIAQQDPNITFFFFMKGQSMYLETIDMSFDHKEAVFFSGSPWYGSAIGYSDAYEKITIQAKQKIQNESLNTIENNICYQNCVFHLENIKYSVWNSSFDNCSFRSDAIFEHIEDCHFVNNSFAGEFELHLSQETWTKFAQEIAEFSNITTIYLHHCDLKQLPQAFALLPALSKVYLGTDIENRYNKEKIELLLPNCAIV